MIIVNYRMKIFICIGVLRVDLGREFTNLNISMCRPIGLNFHIEDFVSEKLPSSMQLFNLL